MANCSNDSIDETLYNILVLPMHYNVPSFYYTYLIIFIAIVSTGLCSNIFSLLTFVRHRIRFTICGTYLIIFSICGIITTILFVTNIIIVFQYNHYWIHVWACYGYSYVFVVMSNTSILMTICIAVENILTRYYSFDRFRSRKCSVFISLNLFILILVLNLDKIFAQHLSSDHFYCTYKSRSNAFWLYINRFTSYFYLISSCSIHFICVLIIVFKLKQQKQKWKRKLVICQDILLPSLILLLCLCPYVIFSSLITSDTSLLYIHFHMGFILLISIPQIFTFVIYVLPNRCYFREFQQAWIYRIFPCLGQQRQVQEFAVIHKLWQRRQSLENVNTISALHDAFFHNEFYNRIRLEI